MKMEEVRTPVDSKENIHYLNEHNFPVYLEDAIVQILSLRHESNKMKPTKFFKEYFSSVHQGTHILFREFAFINATPYNRLCVIKAIMQIYKPLLYREEKLNANDYHSLLQLVWPDFPLCVVQDSFVSLEKYQSDEVQHLLFLDFVSALKKSFCTGTFDYEADIIHQQLKVREAEFSKICKENPNSHGQGIKYTSYLSEADFLCSLEDDTEQAASLWSLTSGLGPNSDFKKFLSLKESDSFPSDEPPEAVGKLSRSSSGSKDASKSEQSISTFSRSSSASIRGRLSAKQLSNSLNLLQTDKFEADQFSTCRLRSKSAIAIQRASHTTPKQ